MELWDFEETVVICDCANNTDCLTLVRLLCGLGRYFAVDAGDGHGRSVNSRHIKTTEDNFVEVRVGTTYVMR